MRNRRCPRNGKQVEGSDATGRCDREGERSGNRRFHPASPETGLKHRPPCRADVLGVAVGDVGERAVGAACVRCRVRSSVSFAGRIAIFRRILPMSHLALSRLSLLATALVAMPAYAQPVRQADPVVVTASRVPVAASDALVAIDVIDREQIDAAATQDVVDLLRRVPGVDIVRGGGIGQQASVFIRGTNSNHALVLIDGIRVGALGTGTYAWEHLPLAQIERIEVVRGPRAALWGADALGGVIQIFTRRDAAAHASLHVGNHDTYGVAAGMGQRGEHGGFGVHAGWLETRGQNATTPGNWSFDPDRDGALLRNLTVHGDMALGTQRLEAMLLHADNDIGFDQGESSARQDVQSLAVSGELAAQWQHRLTLGGSRDRLDTHTAFTAYHSRRRQADWQHVIAHAAAGETTLGLAWLDERGEQLDTFAGEAVYAQSRTTRSVFGNWRGRAGAHAFEVSGRHDDNNVYAGNSSFGAAWGWDLGDAVRLSASWGEGFRAPTMNELYSPGWGGWYSGNPDLAPEQSKNIELALRVTPDNAGEFELRVFRNDIDDLIDFSGEQAQAINIARARIDGAEVSWRWMGAAWSLHTHATWQDPHSRDTGEALLRRPARKASALLERQFDGGLRLGMEGIAASDRPDYGGVKLGGYGLLALRASLPLTQAWTLDARVENLLDRDYTLVDGYHTPDATALLTLRWQGR